MLRAPLFWIVVWMNTSSILDRNRIKERNIYHGNIKTHHVFLYFYAFTDGSNFTKRS